MMFSSRSPLALFSVLSTRCPQLHDYPLSVLFLENSLMTPTRTRNRRKTNLAASDTTVGSRPICAEPQAEELTMPHSEEVNWQPISEMPLIASLIDEALEDTRAHIKTLTEASARPHVMDDATVDRIDRVHTEQMEFVDIYAQQIGRWRTERPSSPPVKRANSTGWRSKTESCATRPQPSSPCPAGCARELSSASWKRAISNSALRRFFGDDPSPAVSYDPPRFLHTLLG